MWNSGSEVLLSMCCCVSAHKNWQIAPNVNATRKHQSSPPLSTSCLMTEKPANEAFEFDLSVIIILKR